MELQYEQEYVKKSLVICATHLAGGLLLKMLKQNFEFSHVKEIVESSLVYGNKFSKTIQSHVS